MSYAFAKTVHVGFDEALARTTAALQRHGFGVLTQIDVQATLKAKLGEDVGPYLILGACNPPLAHAAIKAEDKVGLMLPCNVLLQGRGSEVEVSAIDPVAAMGAIDNPALQAIAAQVSAKLKAVIDEV